MLEPIEPSLTMYLISGVAWCMIFIGLITSYRAIMDRIRRQKWFG